MFSLKNCLVAIAIAASTVLGQVTLVLYEDPDACGGLAGICSNTGWNTCCYKPDKLWGSGDANGGNGPGEAALYSYQSNDFCAIQLTSSYKVPICILTNLDSSVGGIRGWRTVSKAKEIEAPAEYVEAELAFITDTHYYIISNNKFSTLADPLPKDAVSREEYFRKHADKIVERGPDTFKSVKADLID